MTDYISMTGDPEGLSPPPRCDFYSPEGRMIAKRHHEMNSLRTLVYDTPLSGLQGHNLRKLQTLLDTQWEELTLLAQELPRSAGASVPSFRHPKACSDLSHTYDGDCSYCDVIALLHFDNPAAEDLLRHERLRQKAPIQWTKLVRTNTDILILTRADMVAL